MCVVDIFLIGWYACTALTTLQRILIKQKIIKHLKRTHRLVSRLLYELTWFFLSIFVIFKTRKNPSLFRRVNQNPSWLVNRRTSSHTTFHVADNLLVGRSVGHESFSSRRTHSVGRRQQTQPLATPKLFVHTNEIDKVLATTKRWSSGPFEPKANETLIESRSVCQ